MTSRELGKQLKKLGMLIVQDAGLEQSYNQPGRPAQGNSLLCMDEFHLLLEGGTDRRVHAWKSGSVSENGAASRPESRRTSRIFLRPVRWRTSLENSDFVYLLNQASGDRQILAQKLNISPHQLSYVTHSGEGEGLLFYGSTILPFVDRFPKDTELYRLLTTKLSESKNI